MHFRVTSPPSPQSEAGVGPFSGTSPSWCGRCAFAGAWQCLPVGEIRICLLRGFRSCVVWDSPQDLLGVRWKPRGPACLVLPASAPPLHQPGRASPLVAPPVAGTLPSNGASLPERRPGRLRVRKPGVWLRWSRRFCPPPPLRAEPLAWPLRPLGHPAPAQAGPSVRAAGPARGGSALLLRRVPAFARPPSPPFPDAFSPSGPRGGLSLGRVVARPAPTATVADRPLALSWRRGPGHPELVSAGARRHFVPRTEVGATCPPETRTHCLRVTAWGQHGRSPLARPARVCAGVFRPQPNPGPPADSAAPRFAPAFPVTPFPRRALPRDEGTGRQQLCAPGFPCHAARLASRLRRVWFSVLSPKLREVVSQRFSFHVFSKVRGFPAPAASLGAALYVFGSGPGRPAAPRQSPRARSCTPAQAGCTANQAPRGAAPSERRSEVEGVPSASS